MRDEAQLVAAARAGDADAFEGLFDAHRRGLLAYVNGMLRDRHAAEDVVQESFVQLARHIAELDPERGVAPWLYRVARNRALDRIRRRKREHSDGEVERRRPLAVIPDAAWTPREHLLHRERLGRLDAAIQALPEEDRDLIMLRFYGNLTFREIAIRMERPLGTVLWKSRRILKKLHESMERETQGAPA